MKKILLFIALCGVVAGSAMAEKADSNKPTEIFADSASDDDVKQIRTLTGNVILTRGTLVMKAGKAVLRVDPEGYQFVTFTATPGTVATFRQKRDGGPDLWVEGQAERIEYDSKTETVTFTGAAVLRRYKGAQLNDETAGSVITYNGSNDTFSVDGGPGSRTAANPSGRVRAMLTPVPKADAPAPAPVAPAPLRPSGQLGEGRP